MLCIFEFKELNIEFSEFIAIFDSDTLPIFEFKGMNIEFSEFIAIFDIIKLN